MASNPRGQHGDLPKQEPVPETNKSAHEYEDSWIKKTQAIAPPKDALARRPGYGIQGRLITLRANFFELDFRPGIIFHSYNVVVTPANPIRAQMKDLFSQILDIPELASVTYATDFANEIVTLADLPVVQGRRFEVGFENQPNPKIFTVTLSKNGTINPELLLTQLRNDERRDTVPSEEGTVRALNILLSDYPARNTSVEVVGKARHKVFRMNPQTKQSWDLGAGIEAVRGYYSSVRLAAGRILLNLNINHGSFYSEGPLMGLVENFQNTFGRDRVLFNRYVKGLRVETSHLGPRTSRVGKSLKRIKTIAGLASPLDGRRTEHPPQVPNLGSSADHVCFWQDTTNQYISVTDYFKKEYNIILRAHDRPVMNVGTRDKPIYLPIDVCTIIRGQSFGGEMSTAQRQGMIKFSCRRPPENYQSIMNEGLQIMGVNNGGTDGMGLRTKKSEMIAVPGRILSTPVLKYTDKKVTPRGGSWNLIQTRFSAGVSFEKWTCIQIYTHKPQDMTRYMADFHKKMRDHGLRLPPCELPGKMIRRDDNIRTKVDAVFQELAPNYQLAVVVLHTQDARVFNYVKWAGDVKWGLMTHCMSLDKLFKANDQYYSNNAMKVNLKLGGMNQLLEGAHSRFLGAGKTMVVGLDVTHPSSTDPETCPSIAAIVATVNGQLGQWPGQARIQTRRVENVENLREMIVGRLKVWQEHNKGSLPQNILIYRDGVSEGQFPMVKNEELPAVREAVKDMYRQNIPNISIVVVGKRHNVRFYATQKADEDRTANLINGTVVDRGVTRPIYWDFYLQAQAPLQGTARPAHYVVIHDEIFTNPQANTAGKPADILQEVTHNISYMMGRCTRSISYATPAFLADRFCDRARKWVQAYYWEMLAKEEAQGGPHRAEIPPPSERVVGVNPRKLNRMVYI
ncbi:hypothetical protein NUU61_008096 [Penicillium alfredii]|uniref:Piwi domain-containing protein n=1 Tax=Penicillium alfredii TaxID=1506179 RepID=A0A9W9JYM9_9EURO|nr:uncharacterized protein NUU61_008096 [Penicillium alfredii]KAJ5086789.1 hypothetical protein NUU61_008096 [Penicillium alfredii]